MTWGDNQWVRCNDGWYTSSNTTYTYTVNPRVSNTATATFVLNDVPVAAPPPPQTEVDQLLAEVESVCALAR